MDEARGGMEAKAIGHGLADAADAGDGRRPSRRCIATRAVGPKTGLIRFVVAPDGAVVPDLAERLPGRGLWLTADRAVVDRAVRRNLFAKAARRSVTVDPDLPARLVDLLVQRCGDALALARRAGQAVAGFEKVRIWAQGDQAWLFVLAHDASDNARRKLTALSGGRPLVACLSAEVIGGAFGRSHAMHAALASGGLARRLLGDAARLSGLLGLPPPSGPKTMPPPAPMSGDGRRMLAPSL